MRDFSKRSFLAALALLLSGRDAIAQSPAPDTASARPVDAPRIVAEVERFYAQASDFDASFVQTSRNALSGRSERATGHVTLARGGRMRWQYGTPAGNLVVSDGATVWFHEPGAHQATRVAIDRSPLTNVFGFLVGDGHLGGQFTVRLIADHDARYRNGYILELHPRTPNPSVDHAYLYIEDAHFQVARASVVDAQGNSNAFDLTDARINMNPPASAFRFSLPPGTTVLTP